MTQQVVTELVIDSDTSGADRFSQAMGQASSAAQQGVNSAQQVGLAVAGVGIAFVGVLAALRGFIDYVGSTNKELVDLAANAANAGMTTKTFQETLFAAKAAGLSDKDFIGGIDKIGADLTAASRGVTDFGKLFEQNGISIKNANGELKTTQQALGDIANLMQHSTPQVAAGVASIVGLSKDWIPFLRQGVDGIEAQKQAAGDLGVTIDDNVIQKAKEFNDQWHTAIATWDMQFKASLAGILPLLIQLANIASTVLNAVGSVTGSAQQLLTPDSEKTKSQLNDQINSVERLVELMQSMGEQSFRSTTLKGALGIPEAADLKQVYDYMSQIIKLYDQAPTKLVVTPTSGSSTVLPSRSGDSNDPVDRAINTLRRHTEQQIADTQAVGLGDAALAGFRATAAETAAVQANGGKETATQVAEFAKLRDAAIAAADGLARAKVASSIEFNSKTSFLSAEDVSIATQLQRIYGNDVPRALASTQAAAIRTNDAMKGLSSAIETNLTAGLTDIATGTKSASQGFRDMGTAIIKAIDEMIIKMLIIQPLMRSLGLSSLGGLGSAVGLTSIGGAPLGSANGNVFAGGNVIPFAQGGVIDSPTVAPMALFGEKGPEAIVPLKRGSDGNLGVASSGGGGTQITYQIDASGADSGTVERIKQVLADHARAISNQGKAMQSAQRYQATGVA